MSLATIKQASVVSWEAKHPSVQLQQPKWAVTKEIADTMAGCVHCHHGSGDWFFVDPPHETVREDLWLWVMFSSFLVGISKFNTIAKIKIQIKQYQQSCVVGVQHTFFT